MAYHVVLALYYALIRKKSTGNVGKAPHILNICLRQELVLGFEDIYEYTVTV
jgi:hypothetical protein